MSSVINQYTVEASLGFVGASSSSGAGQGRYSDLPTITCVARQRGKFGRGLVRRPPPVIVNLIQAGYPANLAPRLCAHAINGIDSPLRRFRPFARRRS